jgi:hypothetical protein
MDKNNPNDGVIRLTSISFINSSPNDSLIIGEGAFAGSAFTTVNLPSQLKELGEYNETYNY